MHYCKEIHLPYSFVALVKGVLGGRAGGSAAIKQPINTCLPVEECGWSETVCKRSETVCKMSIMHAALWCVLGVWA